jgi:hypothetical protein
VTSAIPRQNAQEIFPVGKANTLLMTPNDGSTLSNGTADGEPTGLHRYVGENRFVFVLLNVTDGHGDLVSLDLETKDWDGVYKDFSGSGLAGYHSGATPEIGRFGLGARLSGSGSFVTVDSPTQLDWVNTSMTVSFWIRPDEDYVGGAEWRWSVGRKDLWRVGYHNNGTLMASRLWEACRMEAGDGGPQEALQDCP